MAEKKKEDEAGVPNPNDIAQMLTPFCKYCGLSSEVQKERLHEIIEQLGKVLSEDKAKYVHIENPRQFRKKWRDRRIKIYDYLLRQALYDSKESEDLWIGGQETTELFYVEASLKLESKRFYNYLVDQVHEDEEIMSKYYCIDKGVEKPFKWRKNAAWLVGSIYVYCDFLIGETLEALRPWEDRNQTLCDELVTKAKAKFEEILSSLHGRCFKKGRNWRNRARLYYLLGLARHVGISDGKAGKFKNFDYEGPFSRLVREMIVEDEELFEQEKNKDQVLPHICIAKYRKQNNGSIFLGHLRVNRLLAWASAANDLGFVRVLLKYYLNSVKSRTNFEFKGEKSMKSGTLFDSVGEKSIGESWADALWNASYKGNTLIVKELLSWEYPYISVYSSNIPIDSEPPLHMAVMRRDVSVVHAFCTSTSPHINCNEKNPRGLTPLEIATMWKDIEEKDTTIKRKIQNLLLKREEVKDAVAEASSQRQLAVDSANAVIVGGTLIAGITFGGWLQPPLGYNSYYQFVETTAAAPPDSYESYMSIQGHLTIQLFAIFNSLSFFLAIAAVVAGMETLGSIKVVEDLYMAKTILKLRGKLTSATILFLVSVIFVLVAFACAGIAVLPPIKQYQMNMYITIAIGGIICVVLMSKVLWFNFWLPNRFRVKYKLH